MTEKLTYFKGTHRVIAPKKTVEINEDKLKTVGITRVADITDLDRIGMPYLQPSCQLPRMGQSAFTVERESARTMPRHQP